MIENRSTNAIAEMDFWARMFLGILATWRITHLVANEDGPFQLIARFRARVGSGQVGMLIDCFQCLSLWVALAIAFFVTSGFFNVILTCLALSGAACLLERMGQEPVVIQPITQFSEGEITDGMLRSESIKSETSRDEEREIAGDGAKGNAARAD